MNTNEKIAKWLGLEKEKNIYPYPWEEYWVREHIIYKNLDFLHDRNQQKWIEDELIKRGWRIKIYICEQICEVKIWHNDDQIEVIGYDENSDLAFLEAVERLIVKDKYNLYTPLKDKTK